jgi:amidohydrolase
MDWRQHPLYEWLKDLRRDFHMHPELAMAEHRTTARVKRTLAELGVPTVDLPGMETGAMALIEGDGPGKTLALRADMDALALTETNAVDYRSRTPGAMHACGHDGHTAILLGVARQTVESGLMKRVRGRVKLLFQPAEEKVSGARAMIAAGALENPAPDLILGCHMDVDLEVGQVGLYRGVNHAASDRLRIDVSGRGGHAGAPHNTSDPLVAACHIVVALQSIVSRNLDPLDSAVISIGILKAGSAPNVIPDTAVIEGSIRTFDSQVRQHVHRRITEIAENVGKGLGAAVEVGIQTGVPVNHSDPDAARVLETAAAAVIGPQNVFWPRPRTGSEDFALFAQQVPGAMMRLGCRNEARGITHPAHSPRFDLDERALPVGVDILCRAIEDYLT